MPSCFSIPNSGHGALFQNHSLFVSHVRTFLDA